MRAPRTRLTAAGLAAGRRRRDHRERRLRVIFRIWTDIGRLSRSADARSKRDVSGREVLGQREFGFCGRESAGRRFAFPYGAAARKGTGRGGLSATMRVGSRQSTVDSRQSTVDNLKAEN